MLDAFLKVFDSLSDSTKRFEERVLYAAQLLGQCHSQWFLDLSRALHPLIVSGDVSKTFDLYSAFVYEQSKYQLPASLAISIIYEAETRMKDRQVHCAMARIRLITFLVFRWLDFGSPLYGRYHCAYCAIPAKQIFSNKIQNTWALLKEGNDFVIKSAIPLEEFLNKEGKIALPNGPEVSIDEIRAFLSKQMDAINSLLMEAAKDIGIIYARSDFFRGIDLNQSKRPPVALGELEEEDSSGSQIYALIAQAETAWKLGLLTERQEEITLGFSKTLPSSSRTS